MGIGKTSLLRGVAAHATDVGCEVLSARGAELERDFGFGLVRQLFERPLRTAPQQRRKRLLRGAAALAAPVLGLDSDPGQASHGAFAPLHGIYWLAVELADERPLVIAVDDAHWADPDSLRCLSYLANRAEELPVLLVLARRPVHEAQALPELPAPVEHLRLAPLGLSSVAELVQLRLGPDPDAAFTSACHWATAGNPLALVELLRELAESGVAPTAAAARTLEDRPPPRLARDLVGRVKRAGATAEVLARALTVLGDGTRPSVAAALARLDPEATTDAILALTGAGVLTSGAPLAFAHPLIRSAMYEDIDAGARSRMHRRAAELVATVEGDPNAAAVHLLSVEPARDAQVVEQLSAAAAQALQAGAPEAAARYLGRALREPPLPRVRSMVLGQLGIAEVAKGDPASLGHLEEARQTAGDAESRAELAAALAAALTNLGDSDAAIDVAHDALSALDFDAPAAIRLEAAAAGLMWQDAKWAKRFDASLPGLRRLAENGGQASRGLALILSGALAGRGETRHAMALVTAGLDGGTFVRHEPLDGIELPQALNALIWCERHEHARRLVAEMLAEAQRRGSVFGALGASIQHGVVLLRAGELAEAEATLVHADKLAAEHGALGPRAFSQSYLAAVRVARGHLNGVGEQVETLPRELVTSARLTARHARGRVRLARGDSEGGIADLRAVVAMLAQLGTTSPGVTGAAADLAEALALEHPEESRALAEEDLSRARAAGLEVAEGVALRTLAATASGSARIELLQEAAAKLEPGFARVEYARTLAELGAALRMNGHVEAAREPLLRALDEAHRRGALPLAERARAEAVAAGARPRRPRLTGVEALTPSELRVARLASEGLSNKEVAQALFVTKKTVADHLAASYRKLGISRREGLADALSGTPNG
jgi:DNA-binding CsgD family transcriptional regulator